MTYYERLQHMKLLLYYLLSISLLAVCMTVYDKRAARKGKWRISERALLCTAAFGGSLAMFLTMLLIRHKTKHVCFMLGLPLILVIQLVFSAFVHHFIYAL